MVSVVAAGTRIADRFLIEALAGAGGMGAVYRARDEETGQLVALKLMQPHGTAHEAERFVREAELLSKLRHPGIVAYFHHGVTEAGEPFLVMEWLQGEDLSQRLDGGALSVVESMTLLRRVAAALSVAHESGVVHRDLKPNNLFLRDKQVERAALLDFGIARRTVQSIALTRTGMLIGTPGYMAPEQARGEVDLTPAADVFSLGCVLFECLTGQPPFAAQHAVAMLAKVLFDVPPRLRSVRPEMPASIEALLGRMLAKDKAERLPDARSVLQALEELEGMELDVTQQGVDPAPRAPIDRAEQQLISVLIALPPVDKASASRASTISSEPLINLRRDFAKLGARLEALADGSLVATLSHTRGAATDQATQAARCALLLKARWPGATIVLSTGRGLLQEHLPVGDVLDRAAALLRDRPATAPASEQILLDEVTRGLLDLRFRIERTPSGAYALSGEELQLDASRPLLGKPTPCVGRDVELGMLESGLAGCIEDSTPQAMLVTAPPGTGKSRLMHELLRRVKAGANDVLVLIGRGDPLSAGSSYGLLGQALRRLCGLLDGESLEVRREKLASRIGEHVAGVDRSRVVAFIGELAGVPFPEGGNVKLRAARQDPPTMAEQITHATLDFFRAECAAHPVLLVLEDLHWGDALTVKLCEELLRKLQTSPLMVLGLARPEVSELFPRLWSDAAHVMPLRPLGNKACERLVQQVLGKQVASARVGWIVGRSDGNALFLEELIRFEAEGRGDEAPETVLAMLQARIGRLSQGERRVLRAASVFGEICWQSGLRALLEGSMPDQEIEGSLALLLREETLEARRESRFPGEQEYKFHHALLREAAYALLTEEDRALGHKLAGEWLDGHGEGDALLLAEHFERGKEPLRAARYAFRAAEFMFRGGDILAAVARLERTLAGGVEEALRVPLLGLLCHAKVSRHELLATVAPHAEEVMRLATPGSAPWAQAATAKLLWAMSQARADELMSTLLAVTQVEPVPEAIGTVAMALMMGVFMLDMQGLIDAADLLLQRMQVIVEPVADHEPLAVAWLDHAHACREAIAREDPWAGLEKARRSYGRFQEAGHRAAAGAAYLVIGINSWMLGAHDDAERVFRTIPVSDEELGAGYATRLLCESCLLADRGDSDGARSPAERLIDFGRTRGVAFDEGRGRWALANVLLRRGELEAAEQAARAALDLLTIAPADHVAVTAVLAAIALAAGRPGEALIAAEDAMNRYQTMHACGMFRGAFVRLVHAEALYATGDRERAHAAISTARERLLTIAEKIADPVYRQTFLENAPENARTLELAKEWLGVGVS
jgi:serine/threonine protein kinase/tetratricopeptide (TPR) repeat protein